MKVAGIIVAAGSGRRMGMKDSKTLLSIGGVPAVRRGALALLTQCEQLVAVIRPEEKPLFETALQGLPVQYALGGATRRQSVENGLNLLPGDCDLVLVHDGARPLVSPRLVKDVVEAAKEHGAAVPALKITDTVKKGEAGFILGTVDRERLYTVQTPQGFSVALLRKAYQEAQDDTTDDAGLVERMGTRVALVPGEMDNLKLTEPEDIRRAHRMLPTVPHVGIGYDVHALVEGRKLILCGVDIPYEKGLKGHSDADVALHALMDALLGACALGDIGQHFPDTREEFKGASSLRLLGEVKEILAEARFIPYNVDITIVAQKPKLAGYIPLMRQHTADMLALPLERVSVKATTTEHLGFEGRGEGISAQAVVSVIKTME